jgi:hypothetical protein
MTYLTIGILIRILTSSRSSDSLFAVGQLPDCGENQPGDFLQLFSVLDGIEVADHPCFNLGGIGLIGIQMHAEPEFRMDPD